MLFSTLLPIATKLIAKYNFICVDNLSHFALEYSKVINSIDLIRGKRGKFFVLIKKCVFLVQT